MKIFAIFTDSDNIENWHSTVFAQSIVICQEKLVHTMTVTRAIIHDEMWEIWDKIVKGYAQKSEKGINHSSENETHIKEQIVSFASVCIIFKWDL